MKKQKTSLSILQKVQVVEHIKAHLDRYKAKGVAKVARMINETGVFEGFDVTRGNIQHTLVDFDLYDTVKKYEKKKKTDVQDVTEQREQTLDYFKRLSQLEERVLRLERASA